MTNLPKMAQNRKTEIGNKRIILIGTQVANKLCMTRRKKDLLLPPSWPFFSDGGGLALKSAAWDNKSAKPFNVDGQLGRGILK